MANSAVPGPEREEFAEFYQQPGLPLDTQDFHPPTESEPATLDLDALIDNLMAVLDIPDPDAPYTEAINDYNKASLALQADRATHGEIEADLEHGPMHQDLGPPPDSPEGLDAWKQAAGTLTQARTIRFFVDKGHFDPDSPTIGKVQRMLASDVETAVTELATHTGGIDNLPAMQRAQQAQTPAPMIEPPSRGPGLGF